MRHSLDHPAEGSAGASVPLFSLPPHLLFPISSSPVINSPPPPSSSFFFNIPYSSISLHLLLRYLPFFHIPHITSLSISSSISPPPSPHHPSSSISSPSSSSSFPPAPRSFPPPPSPSHLLLLSLLQVDLSFLTDRISSKKILFSNAFSSS